jgi:hypothetical protein
MEKQTHHTDETSGEMNAEMNAEIRQKLRKEKEVFYAALCVMQVRTWDPLCEVLRKGMARCVGKGEGRERGYDEGKAHEDEGQRRT